MRGMLTCLISKKISQFCRTTAVDNSGVRIQYFEYKTPGKNPNNLSGKPQRLQRLSAYLCNKRYFSKEILAYLPKNPKF